MENLNQILGGVPLWISVILGIILILWLVLCFLVPFMIYSMCRRIKTIEWNMNYLLFGDRKSNTRNIRGDWRESVVEWVVAVVERRQRERTGPQPAGRPFQELDVPEDR
jgi:hypothetical protein